MSLPKFYAQYKNAPFINSTSATSNSITCTIKNNCTISAAIILLKSTSPTDQYSPVNSMPYQINGGASISITATDLSPSTTYGFIAILVDMNGHIKTSPESAVVTGTTSAAGWTVTIPARTTGVTALRYQYINSSGTTAYVNAGTSSTSVTVKTNTTMKVYSASYTSACQGWTENVTS